MQTKARRKDLDCAKGLAILLVVLGHLVSASTAPPSGNTWYLYLRQVLYEFHMPFFMYLSGYVTFLSGAAHTAPVQWPTLVRRRSVRLLLPFLIFGLLIVAGKWLASQTMHVDNLPDTIPQALLGLVWDTDRSPATSVWYVAVLFVYCIVTPLLLWVSRNRLAPLVALALVLYVSPMPHVLYLDRIGTYYVFFVLGGVASQLEERWLLWIDRYTALLMAGFLVVALTLPEFENLAWQAKLLVCGVLSMPALHGLVRRRVLLDSATLLRLGGFSFVIYLLNTPCIGLVRGVLLKFMPWDGVNFLIYAPLLLLAGTLGPILIKRYLLHPFPAIDRITD